MTLKVRTTPAPLRIEGKPAVPLIAIAKDMVLAVAATRRLCARRARTGARRCHPRTAPERTPKHLIVLDRNMATYASRDDRLLGRARDGVAAFSNDTDGSSCRPSPSAE